MDFNDFLRFGDRFSEAKCIKNLLQNGIQDGMPRLGFILLRKSQAERSQDAQRRSKTPQDTPKTGSRLPQEGSSIVVPTKIGNN